MSTTIRVNIAKYKEDISWINELHNAGYEVRVYNKDTELKHYKDYKQINPYYVDLCNIGRESHTYLTHIIQNYDDLRDVEVFLQGKVSDHLFGSITQHLKGCEEYYFHSFANITKVGCFNESVYEEVKKHNPDHPHIEPTFPPHGTRDYLFFREVFPNLPFPKKPYVFKPFALFSVRKELLRQYPKAFYEKLLEYFNPEAGNYMGMDHMYFIDNIGYTFEFFWQLLFTLPLILQQGGEY